MVHQYKLNGYNIVLDTCSGSVHTVDEVAYDVIAMYQTHTREEIVTKILADYAHLPDVTREEVEELLDHDEIIQCLHSAPLWRYLARNPR